MDQDTSEETTKVVIYTNTYRIDGSIALITGARLTDYVRGVKDFLPVTDAVVCERDGTRLFASSFLDVAKEYVELIVPANLMKP